MQNCTISESIPDPGDYWRNAVQRRIIFTTEGLSPRDRTGAPARAQEALDDELAALQFIAKSVLEARRSPHLFTSGIFDGQLSANGARLFKLPMPREWHTIVDPRCFWSTIAQFWATQTQDVLSRGLLDAESSALQLAKCALLTGRNSLSPISTFPPELLAHIFEFNSVMSPLGSDEEDLLGWIGITHVCRYWRDAAITTPVLWNKISSDRLGLQWADLMVTRSKAVPISLHWQMDNTRDKVIRLISSNSHRTRHLSLFSFPSVLLFIMSAQPFSLDILETLKLDDAQLANQISYIELPSKLVEAPSPFLRRIIISACCIPWQASILRAGLTHLEIKLRTRSGLRVPAASTASYDNSSYDDLLSALERMPALQILILEDCFPAQSRPATRTILLPQLGQLSLCGSWVPCCEVFRHLKIPPCCRLYLDWAHTIQNIPAIVPALKEHFSTQRECPSFDLIAFDCRCVAQTQFVAWSHRAGIRGFFPQGSPDFRFMLPFNRREEGSIGALYDVLPIRTVHTINTIYSQLNATFSAANWHAILQRCPKVRQARIEHLNAITFCKALDSPFLDKLEFLCIQESDFFMSVTEGGVIWDCRSALLRGLERRREIQGLPELSLRIERCRIGTECLEELETSGLAMVSYESLYEDGEDGEEEEDDDGDNDGEDDEDDEDDEEYSDEEDDDEW